MVGGGAAGDDDRMKHVVAIFIAAAGAAAGAGAASADGRGTLIVPVIGEHGVPVYCTHNRSPASVTPIDGGGYRVTGLAHGRYVVRLELPHEKIDMLAVVPAEGEAIVPPVVARGRCQSVEVVANSTTPVDDDTPMWSVRYDRSYSARGLVRNAEVNWAPRYRHAPPKKW